MGWIRVESSIDFAVHAALVRTGCDGCVVLFSGDQHDPVRAREHDIQHTRLYDVSTRLILEPPPPSPVGDVFCCGQALMADGRVIVAGGTETFPQDSPPEHAHEGHFTGLKRAEAFDPELQEWNQLADMHFGRWYPTLLTLPSGRVLALGGHAGEADEDINGDLLHANNLPEIYDPQANSWQLMVARGPVDPPWYFPRMFVLPDFRIFVASPTPGGVSTSAIYDPIADTWAELPSAVVPAGFYGYETTAVLLPLTPENGYRPRVLMVGQPGAAYVIDLADPHPTWKALARPWPDGGTAPARLHGTAVLMATGDVLLAGGIVNGNDYRQDAARTARTEIYHPDLGPGHGPGSWTVLDELAPRPRGYHSTALLTPDGEVWVAGSQYPATKYSFHNEGNDPFDERGPQHDGLDDHGNRVHNLELDIDLYSPDHVCCHRPRIDAAPDGVHCGETFAVHTPDAASIARVAVVRAGSSTHAFNSDQRYVGLAFHQSALGTLTVTGPPHTGITPPGVYLLFLIDIHGTPSRATFLRIHPGCAVASILTGNEAHRAGRREATRLAADLRRARDEILVPSRTGTHLTGMLNRHNDELVWIAAADADLAWELFTLVRRLSPAFSTDREPAPFTEDDIAACLTALDRLAGHASDALREDLDRARHIVRKFAGRTLDQALTDETI